MAVEAAKQIADEDKLIMGYELRDVTIGKAIVIGSDEEGTETTIQLRPWKLGSRAPTSTWQEFVICSKRKDQNWEENCSGLIHVHYKQQVQTANEIFEEQAQIKQHQERYLEIKQHCTFKEIPRQVYESLETIGMQYGPMFQNLAHLQSGNRTSVGIIRIPDTKAVMPHKFEFPCVIHPATLDTIFQMALPALTGMREPLRMPMLPTFLENIYISGNMSSVPGEELNGYASGQDAGYRLKDSQIVMWGAEETRPQVIVRGLRSMALPAMTTGNVLSDSTTSVRRLCLQPSWNEDINLMTSEQAIKVFRSAADALPQVDPVIIQELELAASVYLQRALTAFTPDQANGFPSHFKSLYDWMRHQQNLTLEGGLKCRDLGYDSITRGPDYEKQLLLRVAEQTLNGKLLCRLGEKLEPMLKGEIEPLQLMLEDDILYNYYRYAVWLNEMNVQIVEYMDRLAHTKPDISILEIGAGTGGTTLPILERLGGHQGTARFLSYTFTDISSGVFVNVAEKLKEWESYLTFQTLNIEEDPEGQGFVTGTYDVIVAVNVSTKPSVISFVVILQKKVSNFFTGAAREFRYKQDTRKCQKLAQAVRIRHRLEKSRANISCSGVGSLY
jgi:SAM-dependent methyltransferase